MSKRNIIFIIILSAFLYFIHTGTVKAHDTGKVVTDETARLLHQLTINITNQIFRDLHILLKPRYIKLSAHWKVRGGITTFIEVKKNKSGWRNNNKY